MTAKADDTLTRKMESIGLDAKVRDVIVAKWPKGFGSNPKHRDAAVEAVTAVIKTAQGEMQRAFAEQVEAAERERAAVEARTAKTAAEQEQAFAALADALDALAQGDLRYRITQSVSGSHAKIRDDFNKAIAGLDEIMGGISGNAASIRGGADEISSAADDLSRRTEQQAASLEETAAALDEITATVRTTAAGAKSASEVVLAARGDAQTSGEVVQQAVSAMSQIEKSAQEISQIIGVIDEIAFQTNLLALNAGVEAARAGEAGRGFAVVASEVRALAQRSAEAAKEIKVLISASTTQVGAGVRLVGQTGEALQRIVSRVAEIDGMVTEISASAQEQASGLAQVNIAVNQMDQVTQQNAAMVEQTTAASHALASEAENLAQAVGRFSIAEVAVVRRQSRATPARRPAVTAPRGPTPQMRTTGQSGSAARKPAPQSGADEWEEF
jgi:methyl-accepting chemotaxis protein